MPTRPPSPGHDPQHPAKTPPAHQQPAHQPPAASVRPAPSILNVTSPLLKDHAKIRELLGELKGSMDQFSLPGLRRAVMELHEILERHTLQEECGLFLISMKVLRSDNTKLPNLIAEHHKSSTQIGNFIRALYSPRLTNVEDQLRTLGMSLADDLSHHLQDEEQVVFPALERLLPDDLKQLILNRYLKVSNDDDEELERTPLISLPPLDSGSPLPAAGIAAQVFPPQGFRTTS